MITERPATRPPKRALPNRGEQAQLLMTGVIDKANKILDMLSPHYDDLNVVIVAGHNQDSDEVIKMVTDGDLNTILRDIDSNENGSPSDKAEAKHKVQGFYNQIAELGSIADQNGFSLGDKHFEVVGFCLDQVSGKSAMFADPSHDKLHTVLHEIGHIIHFRYFNGSNDTPQQQEVFADAFAAHIMHKQYGIENAFEIVADKRRADNDAEYPFHLFAESAKIISDTYGTDIHRFNEQLIRNLLHRSEFTKAVGEYVKTANNPDTQKPESVCAELASTHVVLPDGIYNIQSTSDPKTMTLKAAMLFGKER